MILLLVSSITYYYSATYYHIFVLMTDAAVILKKNALYFTTNVLQIVVFAKRILSQLQYLLYVTIVKNIGCWPHGLLFPSLFPPNSFPILLCFGYRKVYHVARPYSSFLCVSVSIPCERLPSAGDVSVKGLLLTHQNLTFSQHFPIFL